jgi:hypothetical protein
VVEGFPGGGPGTGTAGRRTPVAAYAAHTDRIPSPPAAAPAFPPQADPAAAFDYALYEFALRDHPLLWRMQEGYVRFFESCREVLDVGCGAGIFLGLLEDAGIRAAAWSEIRRSRPMPGASVST